MARERFFYPGKGANYMNRILRHHQFTFSRSSIHTTTRVLEPMPLTTQLFQLSTDSMNQYLVRFDGLWLSRITWTTRLPACKLFRFSVLDRACHHSAKHRALTYIALYTRIANKACQRKMLSKNIMQSFTPVTLNRIHFAKNLPKRAKTTCYTQSE